MRWRMHVRAVSNDLVPILKGKAAHLRTVRRDKLVAGIEY